MATPEEAGNLAQRWEHEVAYREMKLDVRSTPLLASHTLETAQQKVLAVVLAMAVVTRMSIKAGETLGVPVLGVSFLKVLLLTRQLWESFAWNEGASTPQLSAQLCAHYFASLHRRALLPPRRADLVLAQSANRSALGQEKIPSQVLRARFP